MERATSNILRRRCYLRRRFSSHPLEGSGMNALDEAGNPAPKKPESKNEQKAG
jgi:hypothetical protein